MNIRTVREYLRSSFWFAPAMGVPIAAALAWVSLAVDRATQDRVVLFVFSAGPDSARSVLSTIAGAMITFIALVFSITIVVLQLASQQFSPRILRTFLRDRPSKVSLAIFVATFAFALLVLREVRSGQAGPGGLFVPRISISVTFVLVLLSLGAFVVYIHHIAQSVRATTILGAVAGETRDLIDQVHPVGSEPGEEAFSPEGEPVSEITSVQAPGVITDLDAEDLVGMARSWGCVLELVPSVGDFVPTGSVLFRVYGRVDDLDEDRVRGQVNLSQERTMQQDVAFGFRQLVDVAIRALSPAVNDPTTAVQALDHIHDLLRRLGTRGNPPGQRRDDEGRVRLVHPTTSWQAYVELGLAEIRQNAAKHVQVTRRIRAMLEDLLAVVPEHRRRPLLRELETLDAVVADSFDREHDRALAGRADPKGLGS